MFFCFIQFQNASEKEGRGEAGAINGKIWDVSKVRYCWASERRVSKIHVWSSKCTLKGFFIYFDLIEDCCLFTWNFQEIDLFQCFDQECSGSREFSILHNRSVYDWH